MFSVPELVLIKNAQRNKLFNYHAWTLSLYKNFNEPESKHSITQEVRRWDMFRITILLDQQPLYTVATSITQSTIQGPDVNNLLNTNAI